MVDLSRADADRLTELLTALSASLGTPASTHSRPNSRATGRAGNGAGSGAGSGTGTWGGGTGLGSAQTREAKLYEAYLFGLVLQAARQERYVVKLASSAGQRPNHLVLRGSPGHLANGATRTLPPLFYTNARLVPRNGEPVLEVHTSVTAAGVSGAPHAADVIVLESTDARHCVKVRRNPRGTRLLIHLKAMSFARNVDIGVSRQFVGTACDLASGYCLLVAPLMDANAKQLATRSPLAPRVTAIDLVRPGHPHERVLVDELATVFRAHKNGHTYP